MSPLSPAPPTSSPYMDRILICEAFHYAASRYHSGQWSQGYAKLSQLSRMGYGPGLGNAFKEKGSDERNATATLLWKRRREIRLEW
jgi:hypothetical protein